MNGLDLHDVWDVTSANNGYTHYASKTALRLDRICREKSTNTKNRSGNHSDCIYWPLCRGPQLRSDAPLRPEGRRLLENGCIPPTSGDIHERGKNTMDKKAATQEVLYQYSHVVGTIRQKNDASNIHSRRNQPPKGSSNTRKLVLRRYILPCKRTTYETQ